MVSSEALILRHYFELQGFLVRQCLPHTASSVESLHIINPATKRNEELPTILFSTDLPRIRNALVWLPGWSPMKISHGLLKSPSELCKFIDKRLAERKTPAEIEDSTYAKIVVVPSIPTEEPFRSETVALLKARGIDAMLSFKSVMQELISQLDTRHPREGLQVLQILSNFDLLKTTQMELFPNDERKR